MEKKKENLTEENTEKSCCHCFDEVEAVACGCLESQEASDKKTRRTIDNKRKMINRLKRIEGQVRGLEAMIEKDAYCNDILQQSAAVNAAMNAFNRELIANHMRNCVARDIREGKDEVIDELVATLQKLMK